MPGVVLTKDMACARLRPDISCLPTRIEDIPKDILLTYGIIFNDDDHWLVEEDDDDDDDGPGNLVIDEDRIDENDIIEDDIITIDEDDEIAEPKKVCKSDKYPELREIFEERKISAYKRIPDLQEIFKMEAKTKEKKKSGDAFYQVNKKNPISLSNPNNIFFCCICKKLTADSSPEDHRKKHCTFIACPDLIESESERERHRKMHDHPTKPLQCKLCKKRYRYYSYIEKHLAAGLCKVQRNKIAKENWRKVTAHLK